MLFLAPWFWVFAAVAVPVFWLCPRPLKVYWLLAASAVFQYHFAGSAGMVPIIALATITFLVARAVGDGSRGWLFTPAWMVVVGALVFFKYQGFLIGNAAVMLSALHVQVPPWMAAWKTPAIPLGISFFTFEFVHYLYEVRVNGRPPIRNPVEFAVFAIFFPTLAAGPIKRFPDFVPQLADLRTPPRAEVWSGARRVILGLFKKICIADLLVEYVKVFEGLPSFNAPIFNRPYFSTSLQEFWRRWHMSLSTWIRDYIYIPLGGNRAHRTVNLIVAMVLCGLWHGAAWNFAAWGMYHGAGLAAEAGARRVWPGLFGDGWAHRLVGWSICYAYVSYGWLIFFYPLGTVLHMSEGLLRWSYVG